MMLSAAVVVFLALTSAPAAAGALFEGRWAAPGATCATEHGEGGFLVVTPNLLHWRDNVCVIRTSYLVGKSWHLGARCWTKGIPLDVPIKLQIENTRLSLTWASSTRQDLQRCP